MWGQTQFNPPARFLDEIPKEFVASSIRTRPQLKGIGSFKAAMKSVEPEDDVDSNPWGDDDFDQSSTSYSDDEPAYESSTDLASDYIKGMRVRHNQFGIGTIYEVKGSGDKAKLTVIFDGNFLKNFVAKFAKLEQV